MSDQTECTALVQQGVPAHPHNPVFTVAELPAMTNDAGVPLRYTHFVPAQDAAIASDNAVSMPMVFVPGLGGSVKGARQFLFPMVQQCHPIVAADLRMFGLNSHRHGEPPLASVEPTLREIEAFCAHWVETFQHPVVLCGISLGAAIATLLAAKHPDWFSHLILLAPAYEGHPKSYPTSYLLKNLVGMALKGKQFTTRIPYGMAALTSNPKYLNDPQYADPFPYDLSIPYLLSVKKLTQQAFVATQTIQTPTCMVIPENDIVCLPQTMHQGFQKIPGATPKQLLTYPLQHDVLYEAELPQIVADIQAWLATEQKT